MGGWPFSALFVRSAGCFVGRRADGCCSPAGALGRPAAAVGGASLPAGGSSTDLTAFGEVGLSYPLNRSLDLLSAYRYQWVDDGHHGLDDGGIHNLKFGLRYWFN